MSVNAIEVKDVTKVYRLYEKPIDRLKESLHPKHKSYHKDFYALNSLSLFFSECTFTRLPFTISSVPISTN